jgi:hypothetical protein
MKLWIPECGMKNDDIDNMMTIKVIVVPVGKLLVVVHCLFRSQDSCERMVIVSSSHPKHKTLPRAVAERVKAFYCSDDIGKVRSE